MPYLGTFSYLAVVIVALELRFLRFEKNLVDSGFGLFTQATEGASATGQMASLVILPVHLNTMFWKKPIIIIKQYTSIYINIFHLKGNLISVK